MHMIYIHIYRPRSTLHAWQQIHSPKRSTLCQSIKKTSSQKTCHSRRERCSKQCNRKGQEGASSRGINLQLVFSLQQQRRQNDNCVSYCVACSNSNSGGLEVAKGEKYKLFFAENLFHVFPLFSPDVRDVSSICILQFLTPRVGHQALA